ncbi:MAG TPA: hypothetical protein VE092_15300 [Herbaspirillum sp.]|uniref:hypothetical protein n=1 Tax=Herbaspirillum sp. TaxID=1890675 RepID=UPI002D552BC8|nr:hypothetical protein [Herbaspirillum sp.]HZG21376.1 hypothetical protein [Herbaspirillum sp.]
MTRCLTAVCHWCVPLLRSVPLASLLVCLTACPAAQPVPDAVLDACLAVDGGADGRVGIDPVAGRVQVLEQGPMSPYRLYLPDGDNRRLRIGYASGNPAGSDYLFVNSHRGYIDRAISLSPRAAPTLERPRQASFALLSHLGQRYLCLMEQRGEPGSGLLRSIFVARIPARMGRELNLYYKLAALP